MLRFSAFPARETPGFDGHAVRVSADAMRDERSGLDRYEVELAVNRPWPEGPATPLGGKLSGQAGDGFLIPLAARGVRGGTER